MQKCLMCKYSKEKCFFSPRNLYCKPCANSYRRCLRKMYKKYPKPTYIICPICERTITESRFIHYDHNHLTEKFRNFLCNRCNSGLGRFSDNPIYLINAIKYLHNSI